MIPFEVLLGAVLLLLSLSMALIIFLCRRVHSLEKWRDNVTDVATRGLGRV